MNYIRSEADGQQVFTETTESLMIPSMLYGFHNTSTTTEAAFSGRTVFAFHGNVDLPDEERLCSCGCKMHINNSPDVELRYVYHTTKQIFFYDNYPNTEGMDRVILNGQSNTPGHEKFVFNFDPR